MANELYIKPETELAFQSAGGDVLITLGGVAAGTGRASAACTLAATYTTPRPDEYRWTAKAFWADPAAVGETLDLYLAEANADGEYDGAVAAGDAAFTAEESLTNMLYVGSVVVSTVTEQLEYASGVVRLTSNKCVLVAWNAAVSAAMHATSTNFEFKILPIPAQGQ